MLLRPASARLPTPAYRLSVLCHMQTQGARQGHENNVMIVVAVHSAMLSPLPRGSLPGIRQFLHRTCLALAPHPRPATTKLKGMHTHSIDRFLRHTRRRMHQIMTDALCLRLHSRCLLTTWLWIHLVNLGGPLDTSVIQWSLKRLRYTPQRAGWTPCHPFIAPPRRTRRHGARCSRCFRKRSLRLEATIARISTR